MSQVGRFSEEHLHEAVGADGTYQFAKGTKDDAQGDEPCHDGPVAGLGHLAEYFAGCLVEAEVLSPHEPEQSLEIVKRNGCQNIEAGVPQRRIDQGAPTKPFLAHEGIH